MSVSIVIPALNEERYLPRLLESLKMYEKPLEIIVVDGMSDDDTQGVVKRFAKAAPKRLTVRLLTTDVRNVSVQRNRGAEAATGETIIFFDADSAIPSGARLQKLIDTFHRKGYGAATCRFVPIEGGLRAHVYYTFLWLFHASLALWNPYAIGAFMITTRKTMDAVGGFDPTIRICEDAEFAARARTVGGFAAMPYALLTSARRFEKHGYVRMGLTYIWIVIRRSMFGEIRDNRIAYEFGHYHRP